MLPHVATCCQVRRWTTHRGGSSGCTGEIQGEDAPRWIRFNHKDMRLEIRPPGSNEFGSAGTENLRCLPLVDPDGLLKLADVMSSQDLEDQELWLRPGSGRVLDSGLETKD
ncbi:hypothetical protein NPIL_636001 [Nephila pilipes]|uniref:Uncharacterized protein n=1 Tax=Nephila pilipes TaxID=299642 RepID=A0A8X6P6T9_NEPPI|nr:hypothetical protein NPIL_636001 [Nephila pilipes]